MRFLGYRVKSVMNITDIDDKTIRDSQKSGKSLREFTEFYTEAFLADCAKLGITPADHIKPISELIPDMGEIIDGLIAKWYAYLADDGSIYYSVSKFKKYGNLAHLDFKGMISSVRIDNDEYEKEQVADFALWKAYDAESDGSNKWTIEVSIAGEKRKIDWRPGWHIECSACNRHFFWDQIDIHMGGCDLVFPHHQNEIAQTEAFTGKEFSKYWLHGGHLLVDDRKMSKSANNFYTLRDIIASVIARNEAIHASERQSTGSLHTSRWQEQLIYRGFRLMALQNQYRESFNFTYDRLTAAINTIKWLDEMMKRLGRSIAKLPAETDERNARGRLKFHEISPEFRENQQYFMQEFVEKLEDDFDTNAVMTTVFELQTYINTGIDDGLFSLTESRSLVDLMRSWDTVIGILDFALLEDNDATPADIQMLLDERALAKSVKDYARWDEIRDMITSIWYRIIDEKDGARVEKV
jgi:cysteinyl-tRNA synthetase